MQNNRFTVQYSAVRLAETPPPPERGRSSLDIPMLVLTVLSVALGMFPSLLTGLLSPILTALL